MTTLTLPDSAPEKWQYEEHTKVKHQLLDKYLKSWISIMGSIYSKLGYIDGFAGRGIYQDGSPGSPILAMKAAQEQIDKIGKLNKFLCLFIEKDPYNYTCLKEQVEAGLVNCRNVECTTLKGEFTDHITAFLNQYEKNRLIPIFYFIDPFGWKGIPFNLIQRILKQPKSEILFVFMTYDIARFLKSFPHEASLNELFGDDSWKQASKFRSQKRHNALVQIYEDKLKENTEASYVWSFRVSDTYMKRTKYYLIYATHNFKGLRVMKNIMRKEGAGIFEFLGPDEEVIRKVRRLDFFDLGTWLKKYFKGRQITFDGLCEELYPMSRTRISAYIDKDFRRAIKDLEKIGDPDIEIIRITSKRDGLSKQDIIKFR